MSFLDSEDSFSQLLRGVGHFLPFAVAMPLVAAEAEQKSISSVP